MTSTRQERARQQLREQIVASARELFATEGYEAVTMRRIAEAIGYSPGTIYLHFPDKESLIKEVCETDFGELAARMVVLAGEKDPVERLRRAAAAYVTFSLANPNHYRVMFISPRPPIDPGSVRHDRRDTQQDAYAFVRATVAECIASGRFRRELSDPDLATQLIWAALHGLISLRITPQYEGWIRWKPAKKAVAAMVDALMHGFLGEPPK